MSELQQYNHGQYGLGKWESTQHYSYQNQQKTSVKQEAPRLLSVSPSEGQEGTMITMVLQGLPVQPVKLAFNSLVVDTKQMQCQQHQQQKDDETILITTLMATVPSFRTTHSSLRTVPISVCFFDSKDIIVNTFYLVNFTYLLGDNDTTSTTQNQNCHQNERKQSHSYLADDDHSPVPNKRGYQDMRSQLSYGLSYESNPFSSYLQQQPNCQTNASLASSQLVQRGSYYSSPPAKHIITSASSTSLQRRKSHRRRSLQNLKSTSHQPSTPVANYEPYPGVINQSNFELVDDLDTMMLDWTVTEQVQGRRLVRFWREDGPDNLIQCGCLPVSQNDSAATDINNTVVSCIYWPEKDDYYITSVDAIYLLESLMKIHFGVEEKNRIRRNLEGFRPVTVAKCKPVSAEFFKRVMSFPHPKPRNIEKDIKAFTWKILPYALKKIITKYSVASSTTTDIAPDIFVSPLTSRSHPQQQQYQDNRGLPERSSSVLLPPTSFGSFISPESITDSLPSSSSLSPLPTPPSGADDDIFSNHQYQQQYQRSHIPNKQRLYYNPSTMTYGCHQEPGVRAAQNYELESCLQSTSSSIVATIPSPSPPLSSAASPSSPILHNPESMLSNGMGSSFKPISSCDSAPISTHQNHHPSYLCSNSSAESENNFPGFTTSMPIALPTSTQSSSKYVSPLLMDGDFHL
ncbi:hypothetical protein BCR42DRAFT_427042, partial [Absidia repens]